MAHAAEAHDAERDEAPGAGAAPAPAVQGFEQATLFDVDPVVSGDPRAADEPPRRGWFHITLEAEDVLRAEWATGTCYGDPRTADAVYRAFAEVANEKRAGAGTFTAHRAHLAKRAQVSVRSLQRYVTDLVKVGLLERRERRSGGRHEANMWRLPLHARSDLRRDAGDTPGACDATPATPPGVLRRDAGDAPLKKNDNEENGNVVHLRDRSSVPTDREQRRTRRERGAAALDALQARRDR